jgi:hypothetical protein
MPSGHPPGARTPAPPRVITISPPQPAPPARREDSREIERIRIITRWLDDRFLDPIVGFLLPGLGDIVPMTFGLYVIITAARRRVPPVVLARMMLNVGIDALVGVVPILGDVFDIAFKAHKRNAELLIQRHDQARGTAGDWLMVGMALLFLLAALALPIVVVLWAASGIRDWIFS